MILPTLRNSGLLSVQASSDDVWSLRRNNAVIVMLGPPVKKVTRALRTCAMWFRPRICHLAKTVAGTSALLPSKELDETCGSTTVSTHLAGDVLEAQFGRGRPGEVEPADVRALVQLAVTPLLVVGGAGERRDDEHSGAIVAVRIGWRDIVAPCPAGCSMGWLHPASASASRAGSRRSPGDRAGELGACRDAEVCRHLIAGPAGEEGDRGGRDARSVIRMILGSIVKAHRARGCCRTARPPTTGGFGVVSSTLQVMWSRRSLAGAWPDEVEPAGTRAGAVGEAPLLKIGGVGERRGEQTCRRSRPAGSGCGTWRRSPKS